MSKETKNEGLQSVYKFSELEYIKTDYEAMQKDIDRLAEGMKEAKSYNEVKGYIDEIQKLQSQLMYAQMVAFIRNFQDTTNEFYEKASQEEQMGNAMLKMAELKNALVDSKFAKDINEEYGCEYLNKMRAEARIDAGGHELKAKEKELVMKYQQLKAGLRFDYQGESLSEGEIIKLFESTDRAVRIDARTIAAKTYLEKKEEFVAILKELVTIRIAIAKENGFDSYLDYMNVEKGRRGYGEQELAAFCEQVKKELVPYLAVLKEEQRKELGLDKLMGYDQSVHFKDGNAKPLGDAEFLMEAAYKMYDDLSEEAGAFFRGMVECESLDVKASPNKITGMGFCTTLGKGYLPFVFGNCNGTTTDVDVFTHEIGHAYQGWESSKSQPLIDYWDGTNDIAEVPSKTMELFAYPYAELFFGKDADKYRKGHFIGALEEIAAYCQIHEFETYLFAHPEASVEDWAKEDLRIRKLYDPTLDHGELEKYYEQGALLFRNMAVYMFPRYVISYSLSQMCALEFKQKQEKEKEKVWEDYKKLCAAGGSLSYPELLKLANLHLAYEEGAVRRMTEYAKTVIQTLV